MNRLKEARKAARMTQAEVGASIGVSQNTYSYWENDKVKIDSQSLTKLASLFGVSVDYLLGRDVSAATADEDAELWELREELRRRPELHMLFSVSRKATREDLLTTVKIIEALKKKNGYD